MADKGVTIQADDGIVDLSKRLADARKYEKQWGEVAGDLKDEVEEKIKELADDQSADADEVRTIIGTAGTKVLGITEYFQERVDMDKLKEDHPEIDFDSYKKKILVRQLRPGKIS